MKYTLLMSVVGTVKLNDVPSGCDFIEAVHDMASEVDCGDFHFIDNDILDAHEENSAIVTIYALARRPIELEGDYGKKCTLHDIPNKTWNKDYLAIENAIDRMDGGQLEEWNIDTTCSSILKEEA